MKDYPLDALYDDGYINGEVYYLCDENGISCLFDAVKFFSEPNPPKHIESLRRVYYELLEEEGALTNGNSTLQDENNLASLFRNSIEGLSVRAYHAIIATKSEYKSYAEFFKWVLSSDYNPLQIRNVGRKTVIELKEWRLYIQEYFSKNQEITKLNNDDSASTSSPNHLDALEATIQNENSLASLFSDSIKGLSVRAGNALKAVKSEYDLYTDFFRWVLSSGFNPIQLKNVGRKTVVELREWKVYIEEFFVKEQLSNKTEPLKTEERGIVITYPALKKDALFDDLFGFMDSLKDSRRLLAYYLAENNVSGGLTAIASAINLSRERVRQLVPVVLNDIVKFLKRKQKSVEYSKDEFFHLASHCNRTLNKEFEIWVGSQISKEIAIIGSYPEFICKGGLFMMVDSQLASVFDFSLFARKIDSLADNKYYEDTKIKIEDIVIDCFSKEVKIELLPAINRACRTILYEHFPYHLTESEIIIPANAYYSIRQRVEDILSKEGTALTVDEIRKRLVESGARFDGTDNQLVAMIRNSQLIVSYGYPCKFGLAAWGKHEEDVYGSIRDVAIRILLEQKPHIMLESLLVSELLAIYTESNGRSVVSNLMADSKQRFGIYKKGNQRFIGLTKETYDSSYVLQVKSETKKSSSSSQNNINWQGTFDSVKRVLRSHNWTALDDHQRKWLIANWKKAQSGKLKEWQAVQILELIETSKKK